MGVLIGGIFDVVKNNMYLIHQEFMRSNNLYASFYRKGNLS
jgi:hypothetical protein